MLAGLVLAAALAPGAPGAPSDRPAVVSYDVVESTRTVTPAGERNGGVTGSIRVAGPRARWDLPHGTFPRSTASVAIADGPLVTLLDPKERLAASATPDDFVALFRGRPATEGSSAAALKDLSVKVVPEGKGRLFEGRPTSRFRLEAKWTVVLSTTGRVSRIATDVTGTIETLDEPAARSPFDAPGRLLPARGEAAEALDAELAKLPGLPVTAVFDVASKVTSEQPGMPSGNQPLRPPPESHETVTRRLSNLSVRPGSAADGGMFEIPDGFHSRGLDRIVPGDPP